MPAAKPPRLARSISHSVKQGWCFLPHRLHRATMRLGGNQRLPSAGAFGVIRVLICLLLFYCRRREGIKILKQGVRDILQLVESLHSMPKALSSVPSLQIL